MRIALLDHYDSFTFNVLEWLHKSRPGLEVLHIPCDHYTAINSLKDDPLPLVVSPGPHAPVDYPASLDLLAGLIGRVPILGVCLGHQMLGHIAGGTVIKTRRLLHGSTRQVRVMGGSGILGEEGATFSAAYYNSLTLDLGQTRPGWIVSARDELGEVAAIERHIFGQWPALGVQFHPESYLSELGAGHVGPSKSGLASRFLNCTRS